MQQRFFVVRKNPQSICTFKNQVDVACFCPSSSTSGLQIWGYNPKAQLLNCHIFSRIKITYDVDDSHHHGLNVCVLNQ
jgi:hypothetical protein